MSGDKRTNAIQIGTEQYKIDKILGAGAMGITYVVTDGKNMLVMKEMIPNGNPKTHQRFEGMFLREVHIQEQVGKMLPKNIPFQPFPKVYGWFESFNRLFFLMDFLEGVNLEEYVQKLGGPMDPLVAMQSAMEIGMTLKDYLHGHINATTGNLEPIIHRDIKPANIQVLISGYSCLLDFGVARFGNYGAKTSAKGATKVGSGSFAAPEQNAKKPTVRSDIYSITATLYCLLAGEQDFPELRTDQIDAIEQLNVISNSRLNALLQLILKKGTHENESDRFQNAQEFCEELAKLYSKLQTLPAHLKSLMPAPPVIIQPQPTPPVVNAQTNSTLVPNTPVQNSISQPILPNQQTIQQPPTVTPVARPTYVIHWDDQKVKKTDTIYSKICIGQIKKVLGNGNVVAADGSKVVIIEILDDSGLIPVVTSNITTNKAGRFQFDVQDTTIPIKSSMRTIHFEVQDSTGNVLRTDKITIRKPWTLEGIKAKSKMLGKSIANLIAATRVIIAVGLLISILIGIAQQQNWLILFPLAVIPLLFGFKPGFGLYVRIIISLLFGGIAFAVCLKDIQHLLR